MDAPETRNVLSIARTDADDTQSDYHLRIGYLLGALYCVWPAAICAALLYGVEQIVQLGTGMHVSVVESHWVIIWVSLWAVMAYSVVRWIASVEARQVL